MANQKINFFHFFPNPSSLVPIKRKSAQILFQNFALKSLIWSIASLFCDSMSHTLSLALANVVNSDCSQIVASLITTQEMLCTIVIFLQYRALSKAHPSRNFFVLSLLCVFMHVCLDERSGHSRKISKRRMMSNLTEETENIPFLKWEVNSINNS